MSRAENKRETTNGKVGTSLDGDDDGGGDAAAGDGGDGGGCCSLPRLLPVTTRELPYLNTMRYIVRVISYISPLNKHCLNI